MYKNPDDAKKYREKHKERDRKQQKKYRKGNKEKIAKYQKEYKKEHKERMRETYREWTKEHREQRQKTDKKCRAKIKVLTPWVLTLRAIVNRTVNKNKGVRKYYLDKSIKNHLTEEDIKMLWFRDGANKMKQPCVHRKDNDGHYTVANCEYMECTEHALLHNEEREELQAST